MAELFRNVSATVIGIWAIIIIIIVSLITIIFKRLRNIDIDERIEKLNDTTKMLLEHYDKVYDIEVDVQKQMNQQIIMMHQVIRQ